MMLAILGFPIEVYVGAALVGVSLPILWWAVSAPRSSTAGTRVRSGYSTDLREVVLAQSAQERLVGPVFGSMAGFLRRRSPDGFVDRMQHKIDLAGMSSTMPIDRLLALKLLLGVGGVVTGLLRWTAEPSRSNLFLGLILAFLGLRGLDIWLSGKADRRQKEISRSLPDVLDQMTIGVEAGLGFEPAMAQVADHVDSPVGQEFRRALQDIRLGKSREASFRSMVERTDVPELRRFVASLIQADKLGVPLAQVLRTQAAEMRLIRRQRAEEEAQKLPLKMIFPLILCILPALVMVLLGPAVVQIMDTFGGGGL